MPRQCHSPPFFCFFCLFLFFVCLFFILSLPRSVFKKTLLWVQLEKNLIKIIGNCQTVNKHSLCTFILYKRDTSEYRMYRCKKKDKEKRKKGLRGRSLAEDRVGLQIFSSYLPSGERKMVIMSQLVLFFLICSPVLRRASTLDLHCSVKTCLLNKGYQHGTQRFGFFLSRGFSVKGK